MKRLLLTLLITICATTSVIARRDASSIKQDKQRTEKEIIETTRRLDDNTLNLKRQLNQLNLVEAEIKAYNDTINAIQLTINTTARHIASLNDSITRIDRDLNLMRQKYATAVRKMQSQHDDKSTLAFIFSAESFTQAYRRMRYMSQFSKWRERKSAQITEVQSQLNIRRDNMAKLQLEQQHSRQLVASARQTLVDKRNETNKIVNSLKSEEKALKKLLKQKESEAQNLDNELERLIAEEQRKAEEARLAEERRKAEEARIAEKRRKALEEQQAKAHQDSINNARQDSATKVKPEPKPQPKPEQKPETKPEQKPKSQYEQIVEAERKLSGSFEDNKGRLLFPVTGRYTIVRPFGRHAHPTLKYIKTDNSGIDIEVKDGGKARVIFDGTVSAIFRQSGFNNVIMIRHGSYISIYANIKSITVKKGDSVKAGTILGDIYADPDDNNRAIMHFEIRKEREKLNPELWVK